MHSIRNDIANNNFNNRSQHHCVVANANNVARVNKIFHGISLTLVAGAFEFGVYHFSSTSSSSSNFAIMFRRWFLGTWLFPARETESLVYILRPKTSLSSGNVVVVNTIVRYDTKAFGRVYANSRRRLIRVQACAIECSYYCKIGFILPLLCR